MRDQRSDRARRSAPALAAKRGLGTILLLVLLLAGAPAWGGTGSETPAPGKSTEKPAAAPEAKPPPAKAKEAARPVEPKRMPPPGHKVSADNPASFPADI